MRIPREQFAKKLEATLERRDDTPVLRKVNGIWFAVVPTLAYNDDAAVAKIKAFLAELQSKAAELRASTLVIDVRGNHGGNSAWGREIAKVLWGSDWTAAVESTMDQTVDWRASPANIQWMESMVERDRKAGLASSAAGLTNVVEAMKRARAEGHELARMEARPQRIAPPAGNPVTGRVYFLTDGVCASACLDFADLLRRLPGVTHIGLPTSADAIYIENTVAALPSGLGVLGYSLKVYRNRVRGNNEWYEPAIRWPGGAMTDDAVAAWVTELLRSPGQKPQ